MISKQVKTQMLIAESTNNIRNISKNETNMSKAHYQETLEKRARCKRQLYLRENGLTDHACQVPTNKIT